MKPRHTVEIDEEGFPLIDSYRIDDEEWLRTFFKNLSRYKSDFIKSPLISICDGEPVWVQPFDAPLVAQSVEVNNNVCEWGFLGNFKCQISIPEIEIDAWNRLHTWIKPQMIPAVLSRKAHIQFLNKIESSKAKVQFHPKFFRLNEETQIINTSAFWSALYTKKETGWDLASHNPILNHENLEFLKSGYKILVPGCGYGHDANFFAQRNYSVTALDFSTPAIDKAKSKYVSNLIRWHCDDAFKFMEKHKAQFDAVFEHTIFCAIDPRRRQEWVERVHHCLNVNGYYFGIFFLLPGPGGPPFGCFQWELKQHIQNFFSIKQWHVSLHSHPAREQNELWVVLQKKT